MLSQQPHVPRLADRISWWLWHFIRVAHLLGRQLLDVRQQIRQLVIAEADQDQIKVQLRQIL